MIRSAIRGVLKVADGDLAVELRGVLASGDDSPFDLRGPRTRSGGEPAHEIVLTEDVTTTLQDLHLLDTACERLVFTVRASGELLVLIATVEELDELLGFVEAEANHEDNRRRQKRLDAAVDMLGNSLEGLQSGTAPSVAIPPARQTKKTRPGGKDVTGRWRIFEMDLWALEDIDLVAPGFIEFNPDKTGGFGFTAVHGWMDWRTARTGKAGVEFSWEGFDEGDQASGRGWAVLEEDGSLCGHLYFHHGDDSGFRAVRPERTT